MLKAEVEREAKAHRAKLAELNSTHKAALQSERERLAKEQEVEVTRGEPGEGMSFFSRQKPFIPAAAAFRVFSKLFGFYIQSRSKYSSIF